MYSKLNKDGTPLETEEKYIQVFVELGSETTSEASGFITVFLMKKKSDYPIALLNFIRTRFIPKRMWIDGAKEKTQKRLNLYIADSEWTSN
jgi:hypothetical protein